MEIKFARKQKTKVDFLIEIRNIHNQVKAHSHKLKEALSLHTLIGDVFHYVKLLELECMRNA